ncbi:MAG: DUF2225 domain-containing protein, partial [Lachnospiraceae bacterium]|nr:DUF2225 domain-containing protein [Lachnospiraceae bacterium]
MGLLDGLEIFGMDGSNMDDLFSDQKKQPTVQRTAAPVVHKETETKEEDLLLAKKTVCPVCDHEFKTLTPKSGRVRRKESDRDLRPRSVGIDTLKYNVICCPMCGYAGLTQNDWFQNILRPQKAMTDKASELGFKEVVFTTKPEVMSVGYGLYKRMG